ncbi:MAG: beta-galactosidase [Microcella sp.]|uniref:beta-galactosidase n=1 Tax=Microcella sp. TaxID=1913979 RepID=UPI003315214A
MTIWFGGDYNPEQWDESVWVDDVELMQQAGVSMVTIGVFSWAMLEPEEGTYTFAWLDRVMDSLHAAGIRVDLATATASPPPWLSHRYPQSLPLTETGVRLQRGSRQHYCPSSPDYRRLATRLAGEVARRYADHPALEMWHINNEYGCHVSRCYCETSAARFRGWLMEKYGTVEALNRAWGTAFWSQRYGSFDEVTVPSAAPIFRNPSQLLDFDRFSSDELLGVLREEIAAVRAVSPAVPITTNFMGFFKPLDYWAWAAELDVISDDCYPDPSDPDSPYLAAMTRDLMRSLAGGKPWVLMEQAVGAVNWRPSNAAKPEGMMRALSYQAVARGADGILFFQWRQSERGAERFHSAMLPHTGTESVSWKAVCALGAELQQLGDGLDAPTRSAVGIILDWDSWWGIEQSALPTTIDYLGGVRAWYRTLYDAGIAVDFVNPRSDLREYTAVIVPSLFVAASETLETLSAFAESGGRLLVGYQSGITDAEGRLTPGGYLGPLADTLGVRIDEFFPLPLPGTVADDAVRLAGGRPQEGSGTVWSERLILTGADAVARFASGPLQGHPAITERTAGTGLALYCATLPDEATRTWLIERLLAGTRVLEDAIAVDNGEVVRRGRHRFVISHSPQAIAIELDGAPVDLEPYGVAILDDDGHSVEWEPRA